MKRPSLLLVALFCLSLAGPARAARNPFGVTIVRFAPGTIPAQMRAAASAAGADVVSDLSAIEALAVIPRSAGFAGRIRSQRGVTAAFQDSVVKDNRGPDDAGSRGRSVNWHGQNDGDNGSFPDPWHDITSFLGVTNPERILQWDDGRMNVPQAWRRTHGDRSVVVAVLDTGIQVSHPELVDRVDRSLGGSFIPCKELRQILGELGLDQRGLRDCSERDKEGHGTWVASRIAGAANGFASNGVAPEVRIGNYKVLAAGFGGLTSWIIAGLVDACSSPKVDLVNMSIVGYLDPSNPYDAEDFLLWTDAVSYCRARGVGVFASAGNEHVRIDRVNMRVGGRRLEGVGRVSTGREGFVTVWPGSPSLDDYDARGLLESPGGVPGVTMVSSTANAIGSAPASVPLRWTQHVGARDQLAYYSNYGSRIDLAAPGGARRYEIPGWDGGDGNILYGGWGSFGALVANGLICSDPVESSLRNSACFKLEGAGFGWLQGTSMSAPNAVGVAALTLSAHTELRNSPVALASRLAATARRNMANYMGPNDPANFAPAFDGTPCFTGYCHVDQRHAIPFADAYGAGLVDAGAAVR
ncbi:MAG: S8 family serine peptidase [Actinomycetota bacterium]|nr:S8 family serine peptidase [Actinomycetota bacterium]